MKSGNPTLRSWLLAFSSGFFLISNIAIQAGTYDFTGTTNGAWHNSANWQGGVAPTFDNVADLKFGVNYSMGTNASWLSTADRTVRSLEFGNISSALTINLGSDNGSTTPRVLTFDTDSGNATIKVNSTVSANVTIGGPGFVGSMILADNLVVTNDSTTSTLALNKPIGESGGAQNLTKEGVGILQLNSANTFTGKTTVNGGVLRISADNRLGTAPVSSVADQLTLNGGALRTYAAFTLDANRGITLGAVGGAIEVTTGDLTYAGKITGSGSFSYSGDTSSRALNLEAANDYSGSTTLQSGVLRLQANGTISSSSNLTINGTGNFNVRNTVGWVYNGTINGDGTGSINLNTGTDATLAGNISGITSINVNSAATTTTISGNISGSTGVQIQSAGGTLHLTGTNTYTGNTTVSSSATPGTLIIDGDNSGATGAVTMNGGTLKGTGSIGGAVTITASATLSPGSITSIESLATGALVLQANSTYAYEINKDAAASVAGDLTAVTGNLTIDLGTLGNLTLSELGTGSWSIGEKLTLISYSGTWNGGLFNYNAGTLADDSTFNFSGTEWRFNYNDTVAGNNFTGDLTGLNFVTMTAVPEPAAALLGSLGLLFLLHRRR